MHSNRRLGMTATCLLALFACRVAIAQSNQEWIALKAKCGLPQSLAYNDWKGNCPANASATTAPAAPAGPSYPPAPPPGQAEARALNQKGIDAYNSGDYESAEKYFQGALDKLPNDSAIQQNLQDAKDQIAAKKRKSEEEFNQDKQRALRQLKGISNGGDFDSPSGLKGAPPAAFGLKGVPDSGDSGALKSVTSDHIATGARASLPIESPNEQAARILAGIHKIKVPPPIPPQDAALAFGQLVPDEKSTRIILGSEIGVAVLDVVGTLGKAAVPARLWFVAGKTFIAAEDGADIYLVTQNETYEKALSYLKGDAKERQKFVQIVKNIRENKPIPEDSSIEMARAAQAILDPKLGNAAMHIAWDAMLSPEARHAALTRASIELAGMAMGIASEKVVGSIVAARQPAFQEASDFLSHAHVALEQVRDPAAIESLNIAVKQANEMIAASYKVARPAGAAGGHFVDLFLTYEAEKAAERSFERNK